MSIIQTASVIVQSRIFSQPSTSNATMFQQLLVKTLADDMTNKWSCCCCLFTWSTQQLASRHRTSPTSDHQEHSDVFCFASHWPAHHSQSRRSPAAHITLDYLLTTLSMVSALFTWSTVSGVIPNWQVWARNVNGRDRDETEALAFRDRDETFAGLETWSRRLSARLLSLMRYTT